MFSKIGNKKKNFTFICNLFKQKARSEVKQALNLQS